MWHRLALAVTSILATAFPALAQVNSTYSRAIPPDKAVIERLNLKTEWSVHLPVEGRRDSFTHIQTLNDQVFVQTRTGLVIAIDAITGRIQWSTQLGNGGYTNTYPVAVNSQFVFVSNVTKLHAFHRYSGVVEFVTDVGSPPTTGLAADESGVYCVLGMRIGNSGAHRLAAYGLPRPIAISEVAKTPQLDASGKPIKDPKAVNPVDNLMNRYAPEGMYRTNHPDVFDSPNRPRVLEAPVGGMSSSRSPSLSALPKVTPPYTLDSDLTSPSIGLLPSFRQPYRLRNDYQKDIQQTPSLGTIPPSIAAALALSDLRPRNVEPPLRWEYGLTTRILYPPIITPTRVWAITDGKVVTGLNKIDKKLEVLEMLSDPVSATPGRAGLLFYLPLGSGYLLAMDGSTGNLAGGANILWRATVGGINNRSPFVTEDRVYAAGDMSGVVCVDRKTGGVVWRSDDAADRVIAVNQEFVYVRDRQGKFLVYDANRATDRAHRHSAPLAGLDLGEFNVHVVNTASDRVYLAADNGLIVCMRDRSAKYARPFPIVPEAMVNPPPRETVTTPKSDADPKKDADSKKDAAPKKDGT